MYIKDFLSWTKVKSKIDKREIVKSEESIRWGEIRWVAIGINIGKEMDGKGSDFARPCLILHTISDSLCLAIPLTSKNKNIIGYLEFNWGKDLVNQDSLCLHQIRIVSQNRVLSRIGKISNKKLKIVKEEIKKFYNF